MSALPSFTVTGSLFDLLGNITGSELAENGMGGATPASVTFTSNVKSNQSVVWESRIERVRPVVAKVGSDGSLERNGETVRLLANDAGLNVDGLQWRVDISGLQSFWFDAPADGGTVDLGSVVPVPGVAAGGIIVQGDSISRIRRVADTLVSTVGGVDIPDVIDISDFVVLPTAALAVVVSTGLEARPVTDVVFWVGGATEPANIGADDVWLQDDAPFPPGIPFITGSYAHRLTSFDPAASSNTMVGNQVCGVLFVPGRSALMTDLGVKVTSAGSTGSVIRFGVWEVNGSAVTLVADFGTAVSTSTGLVSKSGSAPLTAGKKYFASVTAQGAVTPPNLQQYSPTEQWGTSCPGFFDTSLFGSGIGCRIAGGASGALGSSGTLEPSGDNFPAIIGRCS